MDPILKQLYVAWAVFALRYDHLATKKAFPALIMGALLSGTFAGALLYPNLALGSPAGRMWIPFAIFFTGLLGNFTAVTVTANYFEIMALKKEGFLNFFFEKAHLAKKGGGYLCF